MKVLQEVKGQSRDPLWPWDDWLRNQEHKYCSLSFQLKRMMREETERASRSAPGFEPGVTGRIWGF